MDSEVQIHPYIIRFTVSYGVALLAIGLILELIDMDARSSGSVAALMAAVSYTASTFVNVEKRLPTLSEKKRLTWFSLMTSILVSLVLVLATLAFFDELALLERLPDLMSQIGSGVLAGIIIFVLVLYYMMLRVAYASFANMQYKAMVKKGQI